MYSIMKKIYVSPSVTTVIMRAESVVCGSLGSASTPNGNLNDVEEVSGSFADVKSSTYNVWDHDWNE